MSYLINETDGVWKKLLIKQVPQLKSCKHREELDNKSDAEEYGNKGYEASEDKKGQQNIVQWAGITYIPVLLVGDKKAVDGDEKSVQPKSKHAHWTGIKQPV